MSRSREEESVSTVDLILTVARKYGVPPVLILVVFGLFGYIDKRVEAVEENIKEKDAQAKEYIDLKYQDIKDQLIDIKIIVKTVDERLYNLTKGEK